MQHLLGNVFKRAPQALEISLRFSEHTILCYPGCNEVALYQNCKSGFLVLADAVSILLDGLVQRVWDTLFSDVFRANTGAGGVWSVHHA